MLMFHGVSEFWSPLTFELSAAGTGPPAGSAPYPVQAPMQLHDAPPVPGLDAHPSDRGGSVLLPGSDAASGASAGPADPCEVLDAARIEFLSTQLSFMHESVEPDPPPPQPQRVITLLKCDAPAGGAAPGEGRHARAASVFLWWSDFIHNLKRISQRRSVTAPPPNATVL